MTIQEFSQQIVEEHPGLKSCYIALIKNDGQYDMEVSQGDIGGTYATGLQQLTLVRKLADELDNELSQRGVRVFTDRVDWEVFLYPVE
jgi:hypothetical protein